MLTGPTPRYIAELDRDQSEGGRGQRCWIIDTHGGARRPLEMFSSNQVDIVLARHYAMNAPAPADVALIVGSAPAAAQLKNRPLSGITKIAVNNSWLVRPDFDFIVYPDDFPEDRRPPAEYPCKHIGPEAYPDRRQFGGLMFMGSTMAFTAGYWAATKHSVIGFYASDMIYSGRRTHFYGAGAADPLRENISLRSLEAKSVRLFCWGLLNGCLIVNCSRSWRTRLLLPRLPLSRLSACEGLAQRDEWSEIRARAGRILATEAAAPFDRFRKDYTRYRSNRDVVSFVDDIDSRWLSLVPTIETVWAALRPVPWYRKLLGWFS